jgi:hypothetical protein
MDGIIRSSRIIIKKAGGEQQSSGHNDFSIHLLNAHNSIDLSVNLSTTDTNFRNGTMQCWEYYDTRLRIIGIASSIINCTTFDTRTALLVFS